MPPLSILICQDVNKAGEIPLDLYFQTMVDYIFYSFGLTHLKQWDSATRLYSKNYCIRSVNPGMLRCFKIFLHPLVPRESFKGEPKWQHSSKITKTNNSMCTFINVADGIILFITLSSQILDTQKTQDS